MRPPSMSGWASSSAAFLGFMIRDCAVGDRTVVNASQLNESTVGSDTSVGPFAYVRPNSRIGDHIKVGDFVEIKNSTVGDGTKISHLTYVGDSDVGRNCNFGCGTVTVNYDRAKKFRTVIEDNAFIGCNTNLVAPVTVGEGAYIAAGSTITDDIPSMEQMKVGGALKDYVKIAYQGTDFLYVPATQLDLVSKYIGSGGEDSPVRLSKLGGDQWQKTKARAKSAAKDLAKGLIQLYAERKRRPGFAFAADSPWQKEFEESFEYAETDDQLRCIGEIKKDMSYRHFLDASGKEISSETVAKSDYISLDEIVQTTPYVEPTPTEPTTPTEPVDPSVTPGENTGGDTGGNTGGDSGDIWP